MFVPTGSGQPNSDGLQPRSNRLQPNDITLTYSVIMCIYIYMLVAHTYEAAIHAALFLLGHESPWRPDMIRGRSTLLSILSKMPRGMASRNDALTCIIQTTGLEVRNKVFQTRRSTLEVGHTIVPIGRNGCILGVEKLCICLGIFKFPELTRV